MSEAENKASVQHTPAEWVSSNQDHYINADKAKYNSEKVICNDKYSLTRGNLLIFLSHSKENVEKKNCLILINKWSRPTIIQFLIV